MTVGPVADRSGHEGGPDAPPPDAEAPESEATEPALRVLVAGIGNIFFGDDAFGVEVAGQLSTLPATAGVKVEDFGIRGVHLAYELLEGYDTVILVDAVNRGDPPGTVSVIEHSFDEDSEGAGTLAAMDAHGMDPASVLAMAGDLGAKLNRVLVVACEVEDVEEGIGLSGPVTEAVPHAVTTVQDLLASYVGMPDSNPIPPDPIPKESPR